MTLAVVEKTLPMATITGQTDRQTDRVRRNAAPPREEGRIINGKGTSLLTCCVCTLRFHCTGNTSHV